MTTGVQYDGWVIVTGQDFREKIIVRDTTQDKITNPDWDKCEPESQQKIHPPKDLTGWTAKMDIRVSKSFESDLIKSLSSGLGITIGSPDPVDGSLEIFIDNTETKIDPILEYAGKSVYYDLFLIPPSPQDNVRILYGTIFIEQATTDV